MANKIFISCEDDFLIEKISEKVVKTFGDKLCGFETLPLLKGKRTAGYNLKTFNGEEMTLASTSILNDLSFNKYSVSRQALKAAADSFPEPGKVIFIKGLGPLFLKFDCFRKKLVSAVFGGWPMIAVSSCINGLKSVSGCLDDVFELEVSNKNFFSVCRDMQREMEYLKGRIE